MVPKASVTIARYGPVTRKAGSASSAPKPQAMRMPSGMEGNSPMPSWNDITPAV